MRTPAESAALLAFIDAATSDADSGYPYGAAFIPWQETPQTNRILWRYLQEGRPVVVVATDGSSMLVEPLRTGPFSRLRNELLRRIAGRDLLSFGGRSDNGTHSPDPGRDWQARSAIP